MRRMRDCMQNGNFPPCMNVMKEHMEQAMAAGAFPFGNCGKNEPSAPDAPVQQDPKCEELKDKMRVLKQEAKQCRKELKQKKKEQKKAKKELKKAKKDAKKATKKRFASEIVAHLDTDEEQVAVAGNMLLKTWKVKNTGTVAWPEETVACFVKGRDELVSEDCKIVHVGSVLPGEVAYIRSMFQVPETEGKCKAVFRLSAPEAGKFGQPMKSVVIVEATQSAQDDDAVPAVIEEEPVQEVAEEVFEYQAGLDTLKSMGFSEEMSKSVLIAVEGDVRGALEMLM